jgi:hypothetical protein
VETNTLAYFSVALVVEKKGPIAMTSIKKIMLCEKQEHFGETP